MSRVSPEPNTGCWLWTGSLRNGRYGAIIVNNINLAAHRYHWEQVNGPIPEGMSVCHKCDTPTCVNLNHLFLGTHAENMHDMFKKGRGNRARGERNKQAKLNAEKVIYIRLSYPEKNFSQLGKELGIDHTSVRNVINGKTWKHI